MLHQCVVQQGLGRGVQYIGGLDQICRGPADSPVELDGDCRAFHSQGIGQIGLVHFVEGKHHFHVERDGVLDMLRVRIGLDTEM
ncbi:putative plasmid maintenance system antidote protein [Bifidobacterium boum]|uniref:Putative plasmid maintenance system antidote protein n=1 Tax=Bifidobacterium boum TaxID=78343 RepID=A0A086ZFB8_9BIFI|nr:putative plasmid maintenance system antidote protein [Bifidobacterium boum]